MKKQNLLAAIASAILGCVIAFPQQVHAHCDTMDGPVIAAAKIALEKHDVTPVLKWVKKEGEPEIREAFEKAETVRAKGSEARELADRYFFETLVRVHRAGEGAPFTGLKPEGEGVDPVIRGADKALDTGSAEEIAKEIEGVVKQGILHRFADASEKKRHANESVEAGREYVEAYVEYIHYVEGLHQAAQGVSAHDAEGHEAVPAKDAHQEPASQHKH